ncbi:MAG: N-6 DNA methylase [Actinomycetota bacterium]|nr:N-6 DNA methylase [Actinomycetota bacterium]
MAVTGEEIRARLSAFAARWDGYAGSERSGAQSFLTGLLACYGVDVLDADVTFEAPQHGRFLDLLWPGRCLVEMKAPAEAGRLTRHREQALRYWREAARPEEDVPAPPYVVLCAFKRFEVWEPGRFPGAPRLTFDLIELPDHYDALLFLAGDEPVFQGGQIEVTRDAAFLVTELSRRLAERRCGGPDERRDFILQSVWSMFAEDLGQLPGRRFSVIVDELLRHRTRSSADELGRLFEVLNDPVQPRPAQGLYRDVPYANGGLFARPARLHLDGEELEVLQRAARFNWHAVQPQIFGSLLEGVLGHDQQWELGAHYTHDAEMQKIVQPTIVHPWTERIAALSSAADAQRAQADLMGYVVLDPACGSGNFLYLAYRELRRIERRLSDRLGELRAREGRAQQQEAIGLFFSLANLHGIEINRFAVALARLTLWMGHRLAVEELQLSEATLPLADLSGIRLGDALAEPWPRADAIIGNPPYHGSQNLRGVLGDDRVEWLKERFGIGIKDLSVYWFRRAADEMAPGARAGLVGTNSIAQNRGRGASLNYVVARGGVITDAVSRQKWPGEAVVNVSLVNWVQRPEQAPAHFTLDGEEVAGINTRLQESLKAVEEYAVLEPNRGRAFQGPIPVGAFYLTPEEAERLLNRDDADYRAVVRPYLVGDDITEDPTQEPRRWIIDFGFRTLEEAMVFPAALDLVRTRVKPERDRNRDRGFREKWWLFGRPRGEMREAIVPLHRYIAGNAQGKRFLFCWCRPVVCPSNLTNVFAFEDDYAMGILTSSAHQAWAHAEGSTLEDRPRYTPTSCFETFPWPEPDPDQRAEVGRLAATLVERRQAICAERQIGLTELYNAVDEGAFAALATAHHALDRAVVAAYGWPAAMAADDLVMRAHLAELNAQIAEDSRSYRPFA